MKNRTDFSYEGYRWQPSDCDLPEFDPSDFLKRMQNKVIAIVGDSLSREHTESLMCMLTRDQPQDKIDEVEDVTEQYGFLPLTFVHKKHGWAYRFRTTNTTIVHSWSTRLCDREPVNPDDPDSFFAIHLDRQPAFIRNYIHQLDVLVINTAHHWSKMQMDKYNELMFVNGTRIQDDHDPLWNMTNARMFKINNIVQWLESQMDLYPNLQVFFRTFSPVHFFKGDWNTGGKCDNTIPMTRGSEVLTDESSDKVVADALKGMRIKILDITALSDLRDEAHISHFRDRGYDCMHWCLPGIPDTWNELLIAQVH
ncbi:PC-Esterase [Corchorus olitorius]|uniref:PC-Esterase n=1 Tax=Corchorus olitorius TaxID=93759 RepID=A0A1R3GDD2_9ROSI|nr:PC-Esterase [Corchorus olitorius]